MALIDAVVHQLPGALKDESVDDGRSLLGCLIHYTRPGVARAISAAGAPVRHHQDIEAWHDEGVAGHAETGRFAPASARKGD
jgi:tRNA G37 N-methylase TrmD